MNTKEKAQAYDEMVQRVKELHEAGNALTKKQMEIVLPELAESEDERIRKSLVKYFRKFKPKDMWDEMFSFGDVLFYLEKQKDKRGLDFAEGKVEGVKQTCQEIKDAMSLFEPKDLTPFELTFRDYIDSAIRYCLSGEGYQQYIKEWAADLLNLEKKKESQPLMRDGEIEDKKRDIVAAIRKHYPTDYAEYLTSFLKGLSPEDNSEDEYGQEMLGIAYKLMYEHIPENLRTQEFWDSLKFMREYTGRVAIIHPYEKPAEWSDSVAKDMFIKALERAVEQTKKGYELTDCDKHSWWEDFKAYSGIKPAEWSEEDETRLKVIKEELERYIMFNQYGTPLSVDDIDWLKSLRPSWKPSEEHIGALQAVINDPNNAGSESCQLALKSLLERLKKL